MDDQDNSLKQIIQRSKELRRLHTQCTGKQKLGTVTERLGELGSLSNKVVIWYSAVEALGRFILIKTSEKPKTSATYKRYEKLGLNKLLSEVSTKFPAYFSSEEVNNVINGISAFSEVRNYLTHEFAFISGGMAVMLLNNAEKMLNVLKQIIIGEKI